MTRLTNDTRRGAVDAMREAVAEPLVAKAANELSAVLVALLRGMVPEEIMALAGTCPDYLLFSDKIRLGESYACDIMGFPVSQALRNCYDLDDLLKEFPHLGEPLAPFMFALDRAVEARNRLTSESNRLFKQYRTLEALVGDWPESEKWFVAKPVKQLPAVRCDTVKALVDSFKSGIVPEEKQ